MSHRVMLLKVGTRVYVQGNRWGCAGKITRVFPAAGVYHVENAPFAVRPDRESIRTYTVHPNHL